MSKYIKQYSNYVLRRQHQLVKDGKIYDRNWVTIGGTNKFTANQTPKYAESNFIITVRGGYFGKRKHNFGKWVKNCNDSSTEWTIENLLSCDIDQETNVNEVELNQISDNLLDFAYYGSCTELIRASVEHIIRFFPAELYFGQRRQEYEKSDRTLDYIDGWVIENPFELDLYSQAVKEDQVENLLRYFSASYKKYNVIFGNNSYPVTSFTSTEVSGVDLRCLVDGQVMKNVSIGYNGGKIDFTINYSNGKRILIYKNASYVNFHIRPNEEEIEKFFNSTLDGFQKILLNRRIYPIYKSIFITPIDTVSGVTFVKRPYIWPVKDDWNLDIFDFPYSSYFDSLIQMATLYDELYSDNLYRSMTHEAIKNFDWTYTREYYKGEEEEYIIGGTKITNLLRIYGRGLDDIKRYIDGIKFTNIITYDNKNNIPDVQLSSKLENDGWVITSTIENGKDDVTTEPLYLGEKIGYSFVDANKAFLNRLFINSKAIWRAKGTRRGIEMIMALFGIKRDWYDLKEYVYTVAPKTSGIDTIISLNENKDISHTDYSNPFDGLLVREFYDLDKQNNKTNRRLYPWYVNGMTYDGDVVFQGNGGWGKSTKNGYVTYRETINYMNVVETLDELISLPVKMVRSGDIYYVMNTSGYASSYFKLNNVDNLRVIGSGGWENVSSSDPEVQYLKSVVDNAIGNNPHVGFGKYDGGEEYLKYIRTIFKYAIDNGKFNVSDLASAQSVGGFSLSSVIEDNKKCWSLFQNNGGGNSFKSSRVYNNPYRKTSYSISANHDTVNVKKFVIKNNIGGTAFSKYFVNHILPYIEQVLPSTVLYELEGFESGFSDSSDYISLSKHEVYFNNSNTSDTVSLTASDNWKMNTTPTVADISPVSGSKTSGTNLSIKKKNKYGAENIKFSLVKDPSISTYLTIRNSMISITPKKWNIQNSGGTQTFNVVVDGHAALSNEYTYICTHPNVVITKNGSTLTAKALYNNEMVNVSGIIRVIHAFDSSCIDEATLLQKKSNMSISAIPSVYDFGVEGGEYTFNVTPIGGSQNYIYDLPSNNWLSFVSKTNKLFTVKALPNLTVVDSTPVTITFRHIDNNNLVATVNVTQKANSNLLIDVNPKTIELDADASTNKNIATITVEGGSKAYRLDTSNIPSWINITSNGYDLTVIVTTNNNVTNRTYDLKIYHLDDNNVSTSLNIVQKSYGELKIEAIPNTYKFPFYESLNNFDVNVYGGSKNFTYVPNGNWFTINKTFGDDKGTYQNYVLKVTASENKSFTETRQGQITVYHSDNNGISQVINLEQEPQAKFSINVEDSSGAVISEIVNVECEGYPSGDKYKLKVVVKPDGSDYMITNMPSWITYNRIGNPNTDQYLMLYFEPNKASSSRTENIILTHALDPLVTQKIKVTQDVCEPLSVLVNDKPSESWEVEAIGGSQTFKMSVTGGRKKYIVPLTDSWITSNIIGETDSTSLTLKVEKQPEISLGNRISSIILKHIDDESVFATIDITQKEGLSIAKDPQEDMLNIGAGGASKTYNIIPRGGSAQCVIKSNSCGNWVSVVKNNNKLSITVRQNTESEDRECEIIVAHADNENLTVSIKITQDGFNPSININTEEPKVWEVCAFKNSTPCGSSNATCDDCASYCEQDDLPVSTNRSEEKDYDVLVVGGSGKWVVKGFADKTCCDNKDAECTNNLIDCDWVDAANIAGQLSLTVNENRDLCSKKDTGCTVGKGKEREVCVIVNHKDSKDIVDKIKIKQKAPIVKYKNFEIKVDPEAIRIPARGEDKVVGSGMDAKYYSIQDILVTSTKDKFINCVYDKTIFVPWNATTDCKDSTLNLPCELRVNGEVVRGKLTKIKYNEFSEDGGSGSVSIFSTKSWNASISAGSGWISLGSSSGGGGSTSNLSFSVSKNDKCTSRTGAIIVNSCDGKKISIEIHQKKGHVCELKVWPIHPIPATIPEEGGIYKYRVASYDCDSPVAWEVRATNCTAHCVAGYEGGTESVGVTIKVDKAEEGGSKSVSVTFAQKGNSKCTLQTASIDGSQEPGGGGGGGGGGDCSCCRCQLYTPSGIHDMGSGKTTIDMHVAYACSACTEQEWEVYPIDGSSWPDWIHWSKTSGSGNCNDVYNCGTYNSAEVVAAGKTEKLTITFDENTTGAARTFNWGYRLKNIGCGYGKEYFKQSSGSGSDCPDGKYVAFTNSREIPMDASGGTLEESINRYCTGVTKFDIAMTGGDTTKNVSCSPDKGNIDKTIIKVGANNSEEDRKIVITIHPNIDEKVKSIEDVEPLETFALPYNSQVIINGEIYSDYTDDESPMILSDNGHVLYTQSTVDRVQYAPHETVIKATDDYNDSTDSIDPQKVNLILGENRDPEERSCKIIFEQKEPNENGQKEKTEFTIWQDAAKIEYKDYSFFSCPTVLTIGPDGGTLIASVESTANKYINDIKREENLPIDYSCTCKGECVDGCNGEDNSGGNQGSNEDLNPTPPPPPPPPDPGEGDESDPNWAGKCSSAGYDGGGTKIGVINGESVCKDGATFVRLTCVPPLTGSQVVDVTLSICDKKDGGVANRGKAQITAQNNGSLFLGYNMDHCIYWWPWIGIDTPGWYRGKLMSDGDVMNPTTTRALSSSIKPRNLYSADADWASIDCNTNVITVQPNNDYVNDRITSFTFLQAHSKLSQSVTVFQKRKEQTFSYNLLTEPLSLKFDLTGGTQFLDVQSYIIDKLNNVEQSKKNLGYTVVGTSSWCTIDPSSNVVTCEPNEDGLESRSMTLIFTQDKSGINHTVLIEQGEQLKYVFEIDPTSLTFDASGGTLNVVVKSQIVPIIKEEEKEPREMKYKVSGGTGWCTVSEDGLTITCDENLDKENARVTTLTYTQEKTGLISSVLVFQKKPDILPELYEYIDAADQVLQDQIDELKEADTDLQGQIDELKESKTGVSFGSDRDLDDVRFKVEDGIITALYDDDQKQILP